MAEWDSSPNETKVLQAHKSITQVNALALKLLQLSIQMKENQVFWSHFGGCH